MSYKPSASAVLKLSAVSLERGSQSRGERGEGEGGGGEGRESGRREGGKWGALPVATVIITEFLP